MKVKLVKESLNEINSYTIQQRIGVEFNKSDAYHSWQLLKLPMWGLNPMDQKEFKTLLNKASKYLGYDITKNIVAMEEHDDLIESVVDDLYEISDFEIIAAVNVNMGKKIVKDGGTVEWSQSTGIGHLNFFDDIEKERPPLSVYMFKI